MLCLYEAFFLIIVIMCGAGAGDAVKVVTFVLNCQLFRTKIQPFIQISLPGARASNTKQTKNQSVAHPTDHGNAHFSPTQQPTNNPRH
jgi:hypothetical protein